MNDIASTMAKLAGIRLAIESALNERGTSRDRSAPLSYFEANDVQHYFFQALQHVCILSRLLPHLYGDFQAINTMPLKEMVPPHPKTYSRSQLERLGRDIDQIFEIRANSELSGPRVESEPRTFLTHGRSEDWREVQAFIEKDLKTPTIELAQEPNAGRTIIEKLEDNAAKCTCAVIVMTGDDFANSDVPRVRENVMHEIGFFQGKFGRQGVVLLHEEAVSIPTNLSGLVYIPFPKSRIQSCFHVLGRELSAIHKKP
jgi:predicted nucleotide-binding protein